MPDDRFFDTNVLIYAFAAGDRRSVRAEALMAEGGVIGEQVLTLSFYDALIVAAAVDAGCRVLLTEDLQHGQNSAA